MFEGHESAGACVSLTVTLKPHVEVFDDASVAVHVTIVVPIGKADPEAGTQATDAPGQLSEAVAEKFTTAEHRPASFPTEMGAGQFATGAWVSLTVTVNEHVPVFEAASVAVHVTVVVPRGKVEPDGGTQATVDPGQLSIADGVAKLTTAEHRPGSFPTVTGDGHETVGACESLTVTEKLHDPVLEEASVAVHVTIVVPIENVDPEAGTHETVVPGQLSEADGVAKLTTAEH